MTETINAYIRPAVTVLFTIVFCYGFLAEKIGADVFTGIATAVIVFWFRSRDEDKRESKKE